MILIYDIIISFSHFGIIISGSFLNFITETQVAYDVSTHDMFLTSHFSLLEVVYLLFVSLIQE